MLHINAKTDYGIQMMLTLAEHHGTRRLSLRQIATKRRLPYRFLSEIALALKAARLVDAKEGVTGGYMLTRNPAAVTVADVIRALEKDIAVVRCQRGDAIVCPIGATCALPPLWRNVAAQVYRTLHALTLAALLRQSREGFGKGTNDLSDAAMTIRRRSPRGLT